MDCPQKDFRCWNTSYGCDFVAASITVNLTHFQNDCEFHPVRCIRCTEQVRRVDFVQHYAQVCGYGWASPASCATSQRADGDGRANTQEELHRLSQAQPSKESTRDEGNFLYSLKGIEQLVGNKLKENDDRSDALTEKLDACAHKQEDITANIVTAIEIKAMVEKLDALAEKLDIHDQKQRYIEGKMEAVFEVATKVPQQLEELCTKIPELVNEVKGIREKQASTDSTVKESSVAVRNLVLQLTADEARVKTKEEDVMPGVTEVSKASHCALQRVEELVGGAPVFRTKRETAKEGPYLEIGEIREPVLAIPSLIGEERWMRRMKGSQVFWYVENISRHVDKATSTDVAVCSDIFVICGYSARLCFEVDRPFSGHSLALYFQLCRGHNDSLLQWPFRTPFTLFIVHSKDASKTKQHNIVPPGQCPARYLKPKSKENLRIGSRYICTAEDARNEGFIEEDAICASITLHE